MLFSGHDLEDTFLKLAQARVNRPVDTGRKLNDKTFRRSPRRLIDVQFTSCVYEKVNLLATNVPTI